MCDSAAPRVRAICVGSSGCGKTSALRAAAGKGFEPLSAPTIGVDLFVFRADRRVVQAFDLAGSRNFDRLCAPYFRNADVGVVFFAVDDPASWREARERWLPKFPEGVPRLLVGCRLDRACRDGDATLLEAEAYARRHGLPFGTLSARLETHGHARTLLQGMIAATLPDPDPAPTIAAEPLSNKWSSWFSSIFTVARKP